MENLNKLSWYKSHKDAMPIETIQKIRSILSDINILPIEKGLKSVCKDFYTVRILIDTEEAVGQNGKGISAEYALASGYSEFMERLQNFLLIRKSYGLMTEMKLKRPGAKIQNLQEVIKDNENFFRYITNNDISKLKKNNISENLECVPYYNVDKDKVCYLPEFVFSFTSSNGMCAGNTPKEAITQGICEIFERYSIRYMYENEVDIPTIPLDQLKNLSIYEKIEYIQSVGYSVMVKDCTLGGIFPVLAVIIFNKSHNKCLINFGSDVTFEATLMRCLTESFQGFEEQDDQKMYEFDFYNQKVTINYRKCIDDFQICNFFPRLISSNSTPNYGTAFLSEYKNSEETLSFVKSLLAKNNFDIYIHDASFLGYPSYHIYIPGLSEYYGFENFEQSKLIYPTIKTLLNLPKATDEEIEDCIDRTEAYLENPFNKFVYTPDYGRFLRDLTCIIVDRNKSDFNFSIDYLLFLLNLKVKRYEKAYYWLNVYIENLESLNMKLLNSSYYQCVLLCLKLKCENKDPHTILATLNKIFTPSMAQDIFSKVMNPETVLDNYNLPTCGDCKKCKVEEFCFYNRWKDIAKKLQQKIDENPIDQYRLSQVFSPESNFNN